MGRKEDNILKATNLMNKLEYIRNIGTAAHIDHGKTTFSDNLLAGCGMMSEELAGKQLVLDYDEQEQARGICTNLMKLTGYSGVLLTWACLTVLNAEPCLWMN